MILNILQAAAHTFTYMIFFVSNLFFWGGLYRRLRPYKCKIFFSYSHKDSQFAESIMKRLGDCTFKVWIDFEKVLPEDHIAEILKGVIREREIFILLASKNSINSKWVKFEIEEASKGHSKVFTTWEWRDFIVVARDNCGIELFNILSNKFNNEQQRYESLMKQADEEIDEEIKQYRNTSHLKYILLKAYPKLVHSFFGSDYKNQPTWKRGFTSTVKLFDLRNETDAIVRKLSDYLRMATEPLMLQTSLFRRTWVIVATFWLFGMISSGICIIKRITYIDFIPHS